MTNRNSVTDRRLSENALLRKLVDALKLFIAARDAIWALGFLDRFFCTTKYKKAYADYDDASTSVNAIIRTMAIRNSNSDPSEPVLSSEEFDALLRLAGDHDSSRERHATQRKRKAESGPKTVGPAFSPIVPPASSIAPMTPSGVNAILEQDDPAILYDKNRNA